MIDTILFDMDGVIFDSEPYHIWAENKALEQEGVTRNEETIQSLIGVTFLQVLKEQYPELDANEVLEYKLELMKENINMLKPIQSTVDFIIENHNKFTIALVTGSVRRVADMFLEECKLKDYFKVIVSAEDVQNSKPAPDSYLLALKKLNKTNDQAIVFEDSVNGVKSAKAAGIKCIALRTSFSDEKLHEADKIIDQIKIEEIQ